MWIEVFRAGKWTDSQGREREWTTADLDKIVAQYNPAEHEAPVVIGHPRDNAPAYGWVEALKREGEVLLAKLKDLSADFVKLVREGRFKKRSISLYPDLTLRHIGFLGAMPPAVKGLKDVAFSANAGGFDYEFNDKEDNMDSNQKDRNKSQQGEDLEELRSKLEKAEQRLQQFQEKLEKAEKELQKVKGQKEPDQKAAAQFSEQLKAREEEIKNLKGRIEDLTGRIKDREFAEFFEAQVEEGRLLPRHRDAVAVIYHRLNGAEAVEFGEKKEKKTPLELFKEFLAGFPRRIDFGEIPDQDPDKNGPEPTEFQQVRDVIAQAM